MRYGFPRYVVETANQVADANGTVNEARCYDVAHQWFAEWERALVPAYRLRGEVALAMAFGDPIWTCERLRCANPIWHRGHRGDSRYCSESCYESDNGASVTPVSRDRMLHRRMMRS